MNKIWVAAIAAAVGFGVGVLITKAYAQSVVKGDISTGLNAIGLGGGTIEKVADGLIVPS